ncbi:MAG: hypothetical protein H0U21_16955 [Acidimicrobiia bacterium]|nr:hypothetical protein [Acidimicrobiia bacterium]
MSQASFQKQQRERARRDKAAAKLARRVERRAETEPEEAPITPSDEATVLADLAALHDRFEADAISFEEFEVAKRELTARLSV